jgi:hypothetical protein
MPEAFPSLAACGRLTRLKQEAAALAAAGALTPAAMRETSWQDGLDLLAVIAGLKPLCLIGRGLAAPAWRAALTEIAAASGLALLDGATWDPWAAPGLLPDWYLAATARRRAAREVLYICADAAIGERAAALCAQGRVAAADEAALLGYPPCCVAQHHRHALDLECLIAAGTERIAQGDRGRMAHLVEAGVEPMPATEAEWQRRADLTAIAPASDTSVNMCGACAGDRGSAAALLTRRYRALAAAALYPQRT